MANIADCCRFTSTREVQRASGHRVVFRLTLSTCPYTRGATKISVENLADFVLSTCPYTRGATIGRKRETTNAQPVNLPLHARCNGKAAFLLEDSTSISCTFCMQRLAACTVYLVQDYLFCKIAENLVESFPTARHVSDYGHFLGLRRYSPPKIRVRRSYGFYEDFPFALICFIVS